LGIILPAITIQYLKQTKIQNDSMINCTTDYLDRKNVWYSMKKEKIRKALDNWAKDAASGVGYELNIARCDRGWWYK